MSDAKPRMQEVEPQEVLERRHQERKGHSGGNMGAGQSGKENLGPEKPADDTRQGSHKPQNNSNDENDDDNKEQ